MLIISLNFWLLPNILSFPSIIYVDKRSGGCKVLSQYFSKILEGPIEIFKFFLISTSEFGCGVNGKPAHRILFHLRRNDKIRKE